MKLRKDLINFFIDKYNYTSYLEIGVKYEDATFNHINCTNKEGVDPKHGCTTHEMTSDEFFNTISKDKKWDIIFIDGYHEKTQVKRDIENSLNHLNVNGTIVCHDVNPRVKEWLEPKICWNAWEAFAELRSTRNDLVMHGLTFDHLGFIRNGRQSLWSIPIESTWEYLDTHRKDLMQELTLDELYTMFE